MQDLRIIIKEKNQKQSKNKIFLNKLANSLGIKL